MSIPYAEAIAIIREEAERRRPAFQAGVDTLSLSEAVNRVTKDAYLCPEATPRWDTSAMDGYAMNSTLTQSASAETPIIFRVTGTIAAGDVPRPLSAEAEDGIYHCVEIMTGARFPDYPPTMSFDCCVPLEDTNRVFGSTVPYDVQVFNPAKWNQNRRLAGEDFKKGDLIIEQNAVVRPRHIMALASVGHERLTVLRKPRIALFSTGAEFLSHDETKQQSHEKDVNGPYIFSLLKDLGYDPVFLGLLADDSSASAVELKQHIDSRNYDICITTGGVSAGKFDFVRQSIEKLNAKVLFHKVAMRPGHPALLATIPLSGSTPETKLDHSDVPFFGLPGNPIASAACLEFLVVPYLRHLLCLPLEVPIEASFGGLRSHDCKETRYIDSSAAFPAGHDVFRPTFITYKSNSAPRAHIIKDHSPGKIKPFVSANGWTHISSERTELRDSDLVSVLPIV